MDFKINSVNVSSLSLEGSYSRDALRYCLEILCNLCLHHTNRKIIFDNNGTSLLCSYKKGFLKCIYVSYVFSGVDFIVSLHIHEDEHVRNLSVKVIEYIGDITPAEVSQRHVNMIISNIYRQ